MFDLITQTPKRAQSLEGTHITETEIVPYTAHDYLWDAIERPPGRDTQPSFPLGFVA